MPNYVKIAWAFSGGKEAAKRQRLFDKTIGFLLRGL